MKAKLFSRVIAYIIDLFLLVMIIMFISNFFNDSFINEFKINNENYINGTIDFKEYFSVNSYLSQSSDKLKIGFYLINIVYIILYFVILPFYNGGSTLGKKIMGIKVEASYNQKLTLKCLFIRNLIINGLLYLIIVILTLYILPPNIYFILTSLVSLIQIVLVIISYFMVLYRHDRRGIHDILGHTKVVTIK